MFDEGTPSGDRQSPRQRGHLRLELPYAVRLAEPPDLADERACHRLVARAMTQDRFPSGIGQHNGVRVVGILPIGPLSASEIPPLNPYADP